VGFAPAGSRGREGGAMAGLPPPLDPPLNWSAGRRSVVGLTRPQMKSFRDHLWGGRKATLR